MEKVSLVKLNDLPTILYALVPRPAPKFIPGECVVTGEVRILNEVAPKARIEHEYNFDHKELGWVLKGGDNVEES